MCGTGMYGTVSNSSGISGGKGGGGDEKNYLPNTPRSGSYKRTCDNLLVVRSDGEWMDRSGARLYKQLYGNRGNQRKT